MHLEATGQQSIHDERSLSDEQTIVALQPPILHLTERFETGIVRARDFDQCHDANSVSTG